MVSSRKRNSLAPNFYSTLPLPKPPADTAKMQIDHTCLKFVAEGSIDDADLEGHFLLHKNCTHYMSKIEQFVQAV